MAFCIDRRRKNKSLRMFDINDYRLLFECEIFIDMHLHFRAMKPNFYCFPLPKMVMGLEFSSNEDAQFFSVLISKYAPRFECPEDVSET